MGVAVVVVVVVVVVAAVAEAVAVAVALAVAAAVEVAAAVAVAVAVVIVVITRSSSSSSSSSSSTRAVAAVVVRAISRHCRGGGECPNSCRDLVKKKMCAHTHTQTHCARTLSSVMFWVSAPGKAKAHYQILLPDTAVGGTSSPKP